MGNNMKNHDAKIYAMINDLTRGSLAELLGLPPEEEHSHYSLAVLAHQGYEAGSIDAEDIMGQWADDEAHDALVRSCEVTLANLENIYASDHLVIKSAVTALKLAKGDV